MQVTVRDLMSFEPVTIEETASIAEATNVVLTQALSEVYVRDMTGRLIGTVTDYALLKARMLQMEPTASVTRVMSRSLMVLNPSAKLEDVAGLFRDSCHSRVAVVENGRLVGQVSRRDVLRAMQVLAQQQANMDAIRRIEPTETTLPGKPQFLNETCKSITQMVSHDSSQSAL